jgi:hypothetical protein
MTLIFFLTLITVIILLILTGIYGPKWFDRF